MGGSRELECTLAVGHDGLIVRRETMPISLQVFRITISARYLTRTPLYPMMGEVLYNGFPCYGELRDRNTSFHSGLRVLLEK